MDSSIIAIQPGTLTAKIDLIGQLGGPHIGVHGDVLADLLPVPLPAQAEKDLVVVVIQEFIDFLPGYLLLTLAEIRQEDAHAEGAAIGEIL